MIPKQLKEFMHRVLIETDNGTLLWYEGYQDSYFCESNMFTIHISFGYDENQDVYAYIFRIVNGLQVTPFSVVDHEEDYFFMKRLYESVIVSANGIANNINDFFG